MKFHSNIIVRSPIFPTDGEINTSIFLEALYLSSISLYNEYLKHLTNPLTDSKELKKLNVSLYKYHKRASHRCTPFGLFAGLSIGCWEEKQNVTYDADLTKSLRRHTRLDMNVLYTLSQEIAKLPFIKENLRFFPNTSIYQVGDNYRYVEYYYHKNRRLHKLNKVDFTYYLERVLAACKIGLTQSQLRSVIINEDISLEEAINFINELISSQILVSQLEPTVTGEDYFYVLLKNLKHIQENVENEDFNELIKFLEKIDLLIKNIDSNLFNPIEAYRYIHKQIKTILPEQSENNLFQTDLYKKSSSNSLGSKIKEQLKDVLGFLGKISPTYNHSNLEGFIKRFNERYEDNEIPLLLALDAETGLGYPQKDNHGVNVLVEDIFALNPKTNSSDIRWDLMQTHLLKLITNSIKYNKKIIKINEDDFKNIDFSQGNQPYSYAVMFRVLNSETNKLHISSVGGSSSINMLGRFASGDESLDTIIKQIAKFEQDQVPEKVIAEIIHLPESRTGNILARPIFREYEIAYLAKSSVDNHFQIKMQDLTLKVINNRLILFDKRLQREIIPRLGNAHNFSFNSLPVYHFLCDLQNQYFNKPYIGFNWGVLANQFEFLPRVEYQNIVLSSAKWYLRKNELTQLQNKGKSDEENKKLFFELRIKLELPEKFIVSDGDNELLIDCTNPIAIDTFIDLVKNRDEILLEEYLFEDQSLVKDSNNKVFTNECIAIVLNEKNLIEPFKQKDLKSFNSKQLFSIGSEWISYKIYCGVKTADFVLKEKIKRITETLISENLIDKWFFIRYADPETHLRVRFHISDYSHFGTIVMLMNSELENLLEQNIISKILTDTYKRELKRYGDSTIELIEDLFYYDSVFVTNLVNMLDGDNGANVRWKIALVSVNNYLNDFGFSLIEKYKIIEDLNNSFFNEHGGKKELKIQLDFKFRTLRGQVEDILDGDTNINKDYYSIFEAIDQRSKLSYSVIQKLLYLNSKNLLEVNLYELLASLLHMNLDRLFMGRNRTNEFVVYSLLSKYYKSKIAAHKGSVHKENLII